MVSLTRGMLSGVAFVLLAAALPAAADVGPDTTDPLVWACATAHGTCDAGEQLVETVVNPDRPLDASVNAVLNAVEGDHTAAWTLERAQSASSVLTAAPEAIAGDAAATPAEVPTAVHDAPSLTAPALGPPESPAVDARPMDAAANDADAAVTGATAGVPDPDTQAASGALAQVEGLFWAYAPPFLGGDRAAETAGAASQVVRAADAGSPGLPFDNHLQLPVEGRDVVLGSGEARAMAGGAVPIAAPAPPAGSASSARTGALAAALAGSGEAAAVALLSGLLLIPPLYHRLQRHRLLDHQGRAQLFRVVAERPGIHIEEMARLTGMSRSTAVYHLRLLERNGHVVAMGARKSVHYYPNNGGHEPRRREQLALLASPRLRTVAGAVAQQPGITRNELAPRAGITLSTLSWHLSRLIEAGLVEDRPIGAGLRALHPAQELAELLQPWSGCSVAAVEAETVGQPTPSSTAVPSAPAGP